MPSCGIFEEGAAGLRQCSLSSTEAFEGLLDPATRNHDAALLGYGVLGVTGQNPSLPGLDLSFFLSELCLTTAYAADAAPPSRKRPLLSGAAIGLQSRFDYARARRGTTSATQAHVHIDLLASMGIIQQTETRPKCQMQAGSKLGYTVISSARGSRFLVMASERPAGLRNLISSFRDTPPRCIGSLFPPCKTFRVRFATTTLLLPTSVQWR